MKTLLMIFLAATMTVHAEKWKLERDRSGIKVYTTKVKGQSFKKYKGILTLDASLSTIVAVLEDVDAGSQWVDTCKTMVLIEQVSPTETYTYSYNPAPWPAKDRDAVVHNVISQDVETLVVTMIQTAAPKKKKKHKDAIRVEKIDGSWTLTPLPDGQTQVVYMVLSDPGGGLPAWLVNSVAISQPFKTLEGLKEMVKKEKYKNVVIEYIKEPEKPEEEPPEEPAP